MMYRKKRRVCVLNKLYLDRLWSHLAKYCFNMAVLFALSKTF